MLIASVGIDLSRDLRLCRERLVIIIERRATELDLTFFIVDVESEYFFGAPVNLQTSMGCVLAQRVLLIRPS